MCGKKKKIKKQTGKGLGTLFPYDFVNPGPFSPPIQRIPYFQRGFGMDKNRKRRKKKNKAQKGGWLSGAVKAIIAPDIILQDIAKKLR